MSLWSRIANVVRSSRVRREIDEELEAHIADAVEAGRDEAEARRAFGSPLRQREESEDAQLATWLDSLHSDAVFGWRQIRKHRVASAAAILSLALAIGACTSAFRLIDALLLRPLPISHPERLYTLFFDHHTYTGELVKANSFDYPMFERFRDAAGKDADVMGISGRQRVAVSYGGEKDFERADMQYVSGATFQTFGLKAAAGRLLTAEDDRTPDAHPYVVISNPYWQQRFGADPEIVGRKLQIGARSYQIVGVLEPGFTGTEPGLMTDLFIPTMMNAEWVKDSSVGWIRTWVQLKPGTDGEALRQRLSAGMLSLRLERYGTQAGTPRLHLDATGNGNSELQTTYRNSMLVLASLVALVLLIACVNVANLMSALGAARGREMALRVSIGAGRARLVQLVMVESLILAALATVLGVLFAWWASPLVIAMISTSSDPVRLALPTDGRLLCFALGLAVGVSLLFGLPPALRASRLTPLHALKGDRSPHSRHRLMQALVAAQVAFCFVVQLTAGMFVASFERLSHQTLGFEANGLLTIDAETPERQLLEKWQEIAERLRQVDGVESVAISAWPLMGKSSATLSLSIPGKKLDDHATIYQLGVGSNWLATMKIPLLQGRDYRPTESAQVAMVNQLFIDQYFPGESGVGRILMRKSRAPRGGQKETAIEIVGVVGNARYTELREPIYPTVYLPLNAHSNTKDGATFVVRTQGPPLSLAGQLRREIMQSNGGFRVIALATQDELVRSKTIRERMLAVLSLFFAVVALVLASVGLYGVLDYSVLQRRKEIGIRMALGAKSFDIAGMISAGVVGMIAVGAAVGISAGMMAEQYFRSLLFGVKPTETSLVLIPALVICGAALLAAMPALLRALRVDPAEMLRAE
ncbi:ABC transporter permease [Bryobacter aggregatus]|uniref:ABC transporter permease n=1 Tax=Bryobacter aggregatus TaxID=360054 RepID=UPI0004E2854F|nr:ABC transporter permease [Bryobacter aggregatus]